MQSLCPHCHRAFEYSGEAPSFCAYCGQPLRDGSTPLPFIAPTAGSPQPTYSTVDYVVSDRDPTWAGGEVAAPPKPIVPDVLGGYRLLRKLGAGGMGTVYEAEDSATGQRVAVKLLSARVARNETSLERFRQEGRLASQISHPRCVFVLTADEEAGLPYIVMELTPGTTLKDLIERKGPLPPTQAIERILDVIDGLQEAHRLGVVHRDVKPSNCFVMPDGSVKIGDFGLSKSLTKAGDLTQSGAFLGTLLYAAPEQIRGEAADFSSDVYSVSATLFYLLTGRAAFQNDNPTAALARIISEDAPPVRELRPDVPRGLSRIVRKGLERSRDRRFRNLDELRTALLAQVPGEMGIGGLGIRFSAMLIDTVLLLPVVALLGLLLLEYVHGFAEWEAANPVVESLLESLPVFLYFAVMEGLLGWTVGKLCLRLRVCGPRDADPPGIGRGLLRSLAFTVITTLPYLLNRWLETADVAWLVCNLLLFPLLGVLLVVAPMRRRNGLRGLHEWLSGTRTLLLPWPKRPHPWQRPPTVLSPPRPRPEDGPEVIGPFQVRGWLGERGGVRLALGEDIVLGRQVQIVFWPAGTAPELSRRRQVGRPTRARWLAGGQIDGRHWEAFLAPRGGPLADLVSPSLPLTWAEARPILEALAEELAAARADGTLPARLHPEQVWAQPDGGPLLLDYPLTTDPATDSGTGPIAEAPAGDGMLERLQQQREARRGGKDGAAEAEEQLAFLRRVAVLALEGAPRPTDAAPAPIRAPLPPHATDLLLRLMGVRHADRDLDDFRADLTMTRSLPTAVTRAMRAGQLGVQAIFLAPLLLTMLLVGLAYSQQCWAHAQQARAAEHVVLRLNDTGSGRAKFLERTGLSEPLPAGLEQRIEMTARLATRAWQQERNQLFAPERWWVDWLVRVASSDFGDAESLAIALAPTIAPDELFAGGLLLVGLGPVLWVLSALAFRGGLSFVLLGLTLVTADGQPAARWRCAWRSLVLWLPVAGLLTLNLAAQTIWPVALPGRWLFWGAAVGLMAGYLVLALLTPSRALLDRLAGTNLVPK